MRELVFLSNILTKHITQNQLRENKNLSSNTSKKKKKSKTHYLNN